jgi:hypothetical protein
LDAIDATAQDIIECSLAHCAARSRSTAIASNSGRSSTTALARTWLATASRDFGPVSVRHPLGRGSKASGIFEINVDRSKRIRTCAWTTLVQRLAPCEALPRHRRQHRRYCGMNASWEDA